MVLHQYITLRKFFREYYLQQKLSRQIPPTHCHSTTHATSSAWNLLFVRTLNIYLEIFLGKIKVCSFLHYCYTCQPHAFVAFLVHVSTSPIAACFPYILLSDAFAVRFKLMPSPVKLFSCKNIFVQFDPCKNYFRGYFYKNFLAKMKPITVHHCIVPISLTGDSTTTRSRRSRNPVQSPL